MEEKRLEPSELTLLFKMTVVTTHNQLMPCEVYMAKLEDGFDFYRVICWNGKTTELIIDVDFDAEMGWYDVYEGIPSVWSDMVADGLNYHKAQFSKLN